jgi:hydroxyacylglutathione hydrolase
MLLKYFYDEKLAHASYMVGCQATGEAIIIDPARDIRPYLEAAEEEEMTIIGSAETHIHADYVSGSRELAERVGAKLYLSDEGDENWKYTYLDGYDHQLLYDGDKFMVGKIELEVMHSPGHTPEHISFLVTDRGGGANEPMGIFTGDFVFVGSIGRPDLLEKAAGIADTAEAGARDMFRSVQRFKQLPDFVQVWPAHGAGSACGKGLGAIPSSTVGYEKLFNAALSYEDEDQFVEALLAGQPEAPKYFAVMKRVNKEGPAVLGERELPPRVDPAKLAGLVDEGQMVLDTRAYDQFAAGHVTGAINIPENYLASWAGWFVDYGKPLYLVTYADQVDEMVRILAEIGIDNVVGYFDAEAVNARGLFTESYSMGSPDELKDQILNDEVLLLDIRAESEWEEFRLPNARHLMLGYLMDRADEAINGKPIVVQCRTGGRSAIGASILQARGAKQVINMEGGIRDWQLAGLPVEK